MEFIPNPITKPNRVLILQIVEETYNLQKETIICTVFICYTHCYCYNYCWDTYKKLNNDRAHIFKLSLTAILSNCLNSLE